VADAEVFRLALRALIEALPAELRSRVELSRG
jgi:hypothetical protein